MNLELLLNGQPVKLRLDRDGENWRANPVSLSVGEGATVTAGQALAVLEQVRTPLESGG